MVDSPRQMLPFAPGYSEGATGLEQPGYHLVLAGACCEARFLMCSPLSPRQRYLSRGSDTLS